ncbi:MAG: glycosyltransferase family 4 protein [Acidobacteria bacterium]|nr:glycosyltransferase family 4 protein [Acidobacteriota bacterium]
MTPQVRVAVIARAVAPLHGVGGGLERSVHDLVRYLSSHDVHVTLITRPPTTPGNPGPSVPNAAGGVLQTQAGSVIDPRIRTIIVPYRTFPFAGRRGTTVIDRSTAYPLFGMRAGYVAWQLARSGRVDLVHAFGASALGYARKRRQSTVPLVLNPQGLEEFGATDPARAPVKRAAYLPLRWAVRACAAAADAVIATDRSLEPAVRQHLDVPADRVRIIPNALDLDLLDRLATPASGAGIRRRAGIGPRERVLLSVGRLEASKGFDVLAAAIAALVEHGTALVEPWRWVVVGEGPYRGQLERIITDAGLSNRVLLTGRLPDADVHAWYEGATLFVHPTLYEGSSLVTLEAMAHRRAVVATTAGGIPDKVRPGVNGWLVPPGRADALAAALSGALGEAGRLAGMGQAGRAIVEAEFSWRTIGPATLRMYDDLLRNH